MDRIKFKLDLLAKIADLQNKITCEVQPPEDEDNEEYVHDLQTLISIDEKIDECLGIWYY